MMKRTLQIGRPFATTFLAIASGLNANLALSQSPCIPTTEKTVACQCGQWTCPACQARTRCVPTCPPFGSNNDSLSVPSGTDSGLGGLPTPPSGSTAPDRSASDAAAAFSAAMNSNQFNPQSRGFSDQLASSGSGNFASAIEFQGDNFGTGAGQSVVGQVFSAQNVPGFDFGTNVVFDLPGNNFVDLVSTGPGTGVLGSSVSLSEPPPGSDAEVPTGNEFAFQGGVATVVGTDLYNTQYVYVSPVSIPSSVTGRMKLAENVSPLPRDRVFFNYSLFNNVPLTPQGIGVNRFTPGFEKTFLGKLASVELRTPFAGTLDSNIFTDGSTNTSNAEFGNIFIALKGILLSTDKWAISAGTSLTLPTADDNRVFTRSGTELIRIKNESVHIMPFIGGVYAPTSRFFAQGILQVDIDSNGNTVLGQTSTTGLSKIGTFQDSTFLYADIGLGYWAMKRQPGDRSFLQGIIPNVEAHWNRSLNDADCVTSQITGTGATPVTTAVIQPVINQLDVLNMVSGVALQFRNNSRLAVGYAAPVGNSQDRVFDGEWRAMWNKFY